MKILYKSKKGEIAGNILLLLILNCFTYLFFKQNYFFKYFIIVNAVIMPLFFFLSKEIVLCNSYIKVNYVFFPFLSQKFDLADIKYLCFGSNNATSSFEFIKIYYNDKKKSSFYFTSGMDFQILINELRKLDKTVQIVSDKWK